MHNLEQLEQEMKASDRESHKFLALVVLAVVALCVVLAALLFHFVENPQPWLMGAVMPVILLTQAWIMRRSQQRRARIFARHGFQCQNCGRTPYSVRLLKQTSSKFCPFCQMKYVP